MQTGDAFDAVVQDLIEEGAPGAAVAVLRNGEFIHRKAYGLADLEWGAALRPDCSFRIASLTKPFTAAAIMRLAEQGALGVDDPLERHLPAFDQRGRKVTLRHLLNHTSGIRNHDRDHARRTDRANIPRARLLEEILAAPFDFEPGRRYSYCNSGYILLGAVIEAASGRSYEAFLQAEFFAPLGMARTRLCLADAVIPLRARGYVRGRSGFHNARPDPTNWSHSAGGLCSTLDDLAVWDGALRDGRAIGRDSLAATLQPTPLGDGSLYPYGFGWGTAVYEGRALHHHAGGVSGFACQMARLTDEALTTIVLSNLYLFPFDRVTRGLLRAALGLPPIAAATRPASPGALSAIAGRYRDGDGAEIVVGGGPADPSGFMTLGDGRFCHPGDPEVEFRFQGLEHGKYAEMNHVSPLWPTRRFVRD
ncbi:MAG TPA: serine hydrolase domain-containing protein [Caulobacteraceae bacterium]|nr:serine hydrolase domain-containing protein [Caulobacteraceae bacterium]